LEPLFLSRRPPQRASPEQVDVEVIDGLAAIVAGVYYQSKPVGGDAFGSGDLPRGDQQMSE